jgi:hypothetical protein
MGEKLRMLAFQMARERPTKPLIWIDVHPISRLPSGQAARTTKC